MALNSYSGLVTALQSWLNRSNLNDLIPDFITLFEARMNRMVRHPRMEAVATATADAEEVALPDDFLQLRMVRIDDQVLLGMAPQALHERYYNNSTTTPAAYAVSGNYLLLAPAPDATNTVEVEISYYQAIPALTDSNTTNWLLEEYPDAYLYGVLCIGAGAYLRDDERLAMWKGAWDELLAEIDMDAVKRRLPAGPLVAQGPVYE